MTNVVLGNVGSQVALQVAQTGKQRRRTRSPKHAFQTKFRPFQLQPFMIAPVLPGETLKNALVQCQAKTRALAADHDQVGWWFEMGFYYVKLTDMDGHETLKEMLLDTTTSLTSLETAANAATYHNGGGLDFTSMCLDRVVDEFFRDEDDGTVTFDGLPQAAIRVRTGLESMRLESATAPADDQLPGTDGVVPDHLSAQFAEHYAQWEHMRNLKMVDASFEDWVKAFGVTPDGDVQEDPRKPEELRYLSDWRKPSIAIDGDGTTTSACVWDVGDTISSKKFFNEPGFIFGVMTARPKIMLNNQTGALSHFLADAFSWLPASLKADPFTSLKEFAAAAADDGPLGSTPTGDYWVDMRDLFIHGDQFFNATPASKAALPTSTTAQRFMAEADIDALFSDAAGGNKHIRTDGVVSLDILGMQADHTP